MEGMDRTTVFVYDPWRAGLQGARSTNALQRSTSCRYYRTVHYDTDSNGQYPDYNLNLWCGCCNRKVKNRHKDSSSSKVWFECGVYCIRGVYFVPIYIIYMVRGIPADGRRERQKIRRNEAVGARLVLYLKKTQNMCPLYAVVFIGRLHTTPERSHSSDRRYNGGILSIWSTSVCAFMFGRALISAFPLLLPSFPPFFNLVAYTRYKTA